MLQCQAQVPMLQRKYFAVTQIKAIVSLTLIHNSYNPHTLGLENACIPIFVVLFPVVNVARVLEGIRKEDMQVIKMIKIVFIGQLFY